MAMDDETKRRMDEKLEEIRAARAEHEAETAREEAAEAASAAPVIPAPESLPVPPLPETAPAAPKQTGLESVVTRLGGTVDDGRVALNGKKLSVKDIEDLAVVLQPSDVKVLEIKQAGLEAGHIDALNKAIPQSLEQLDLRANVNLGNAGVDKLLNAGHGIKEYNLINSGIDNQGAINIGRKAYQENGAVNYLLDPNYKQESVKAYKNAEEAEKALYSAKTQLEFTSKAFEAVKRDKALGELQKLEKFNDGKGFSFDVGHPNHNGERVLHQIAKEYHEKVFVDKSDAMKWLVEEKGASIDGVNDKGETPLKLADQVHNDIYTEFMVTKLGAQVPAAIAEAIIAKQAEETITLTPYEIKKGETFDTVSAKFSMSPADLRKYNDQYETGTEPSVGSSVFIPLPKKDVDAVLASEAELAKLQQINQAAKLQAAADMKAAQEQAAAAEAEARKAAQVEADRVAKAEADRQAAEAAAKEQQAQMVAAQQQAAEDARKVAEKQAADAAAEEARKVTEKQATDARAAEEVQKAALVANSAQAANGEPASKANPASAETLKSAEVPSYSTDEAARILTDGLPKDRQVLESIAKNFGAEGNKYTFANGSEYAVPGKESRDLISALKSNDSTKIAEAYEAAYNAKKELPALDTKLVTDLREQLDVIKQKGIKGENTAFAATREILKSAGITSPKVERYADAEGQLQGEVSFITFSDTRKLENAVNQAEKRGVLDDKAREQLSKALEDCLQPGYTPPSVMAKEAEKQASK